MKPTIWIKSSVGGAIRSLRKQVGLSQAELAMRANISRNTLSAIEGGSDTTIKTLISVLEVLGYTIDFHLEDK